MDREALEYTKLHYDRHAGRHVDQREALQARASGPSAPLKRFHNEIKRKLIQRFASGADRLLDFACGRGGDILKWMDSGIHYVKGIDLSPGEIQEAKQRYSELYKQRKAKGQSPTICEFIDSSALGLEEWREPEQYDVVTCMFAIHYFFAAEKALQQFLHNVSINLKVGGYFIGTVPEAKKVVECVRAGPVYNTPMLRVEAHWKGQPSPFGSPYICAIGDTVTGSEQDTQGSFEYLVYQSVFAAVAAQHGLEPVYDYNDPALEKLFKEGSFAKAASGKGQLLKHFAPRFPPESDPSLTWASELFSAFVFKKVREVDTGVGGGVASVKEVKGSSVQQQQQPQQTQQPKASVEQNGDKAAAGEHGIKRARDIKGKEAADREEEEHAAKKQKDAAAGDNDEQQEEEDGGDEGDYGDP